MLQHVRVHVQTFSTCLFPRAPKEKEKREKREGREVKSIRRILLFAFITPFFITKTTTTNKLLPTSTIIKRIVFLVNIELQIHLIKCIWTSIYHLDFSSIYILSRDCLVDPIIFDWSDTIIQDSRKYHHCYTILKI